jgi:xylan 1,4-beta-xylosidase
MNTFPMASALIAALGLVACSSNNGGRASSDTGGNRGSGGRIGATGGVGDAGGKGGGKGGAAGGASGGAGSGGIPLGAGGGGGSSKGGGVGGSGSAGGSAGMTESGGTAGGGILGSGGSAAGGTTGSGSRPLTFANPMDLPYRFTLKDSPNARGVSCREAADPTMVAFKGEYWLFASKVGGYWHSKDMLHWDLIQPTGFPLEDYAPTVLVVGGKWLLTTSNGGALYASDDPAGGKWAKLRDLPSYSDPALFLDDDGRVYVYWGSSSDGWMQGVELDTKNNFAPVGTAAALIPKADPLHHGWEAMVLTATDDQMKSSAPSWTEGTWMNKRSGVYYLQFASPSSELRNYGDGVYVSSKPLGPFSYVSYNPFSYKPTGFIGAAGHGSTYQDNRGGYWHIATMIVGVGYMWDRRLGIFPTGFVPNGNDPDQMLSNSYLADYPQLAPGLATDPLTDNTAGWMLVSLKKKATASSTLDAQHTPDQAFDEDVATSWAAATNNAGEWLQADLGKPCRIDAVQLNFADIGSTAYGRLVGDTYQYTFQVSDDATTWRMVLDRRNGGRDAPHEYVQLDQPVTGRYVKLTNSHTPAGAVFSMSGLRIFGSGLGQPPERVTGAVAQRESNQRLMDVSWQASPSADFYIVRYGVRSNRLTRSHQVYGNTAVTIPGLETDEDYFFTVDAVNDSGVTKGTEVKAVLSDHPG